MRPTLPRVLGRGQTRIPACNAIGSPGRWRRAPPLHPPDSMVGHRQTRRRHADRASARAPAPGEPDDRDPRPPLARPEPVARQHHPPDARLAGRSRATSRSSTSRASPPTRRSTTRRSAARDAYDDAVRSSRRRGLLARGDVLRPRDRRPRPRGGPVPARLPRLRAIDGFVSLEVCPLIAYDSGHDPRDAKRLPRRRPRRTCSSRSRARREGLVAIEEAIFAGVPINVTLLFSPAQYLACAEAYTRGIERRVEAGLDPFVASVASLFISRWDAAVTDRVPADLALKLGLAVGGAAYAEYVAFYASPRWQALQAKGATPQRLLFASTGTKDPTALEDAVHRRARRPRHRQHDARGDAPRPRGRRRHVPPAADRRRRRPARPSPASRRPGSRSTASASSSSRRAPSRS